MNVQDIKELLDSFNQQANNIKEQLDSLLVTVSDNRVPSEEEISVFNTEIIALRDKYNSIYAVAKTMVLDDELPTPGMNANAYVEAVQDSQIRVLREQANQAKDVITKFIAIQSSLDMYVQALKPYQDAASELLEQINESTINDLLPKTEAPKAFLAAMEYNNIGASSEGLDLMRKIRQHYPEEVQWGLAARQYFYADKISETIASAGGSAEAEVLALNKDQGDTASILKITNKTKSGTPSASSFRKDIVKMARINRKVRTVLPLFTNLGVLTREQCFLFGVCMNCFDETDQSREHVSSAIESLVTKGYLARFKYEDTGENVYAYCLSNYCSSCMEKASIATQMKDFWLLSFGNYKLHTDNNMERAVIVNAVSANEQLLKYVYTVKDILTEKEFRTVKSSIIWKENFYQVTVFYEDIPYCCRLVNRLESADNIQAENILVCDEIFSAESFHNKYCENVFVLSKGNICRFNYEENAASFPDILSDSNAEDRDNKAELDKAEPTAVHAERSAANTDSLAEGEKNATTPLELLRKKSVPKDSEFYKVILGILNKESSTKEQLKTVIVNAALLAKGAGLEKNCPDTKLLSLQLRLATNVLIDESAYTSETLATAFDDAGDDNSSLMLAAYLFAMLAPAVPFDYGLTNKTESLFGDYETNFRGLEAFKPLFNKMMFVRKVSATGFSPASIALLGSDAESESFLGGLRKKAQQYLTVQTPKTRMKALPILYNDCFGSNSELHECMKMIAENKKDSESLGFVQLVLAEFCDIRNETYVLNEAKTEKRLKDKWNEKNDFKLAYDAYDQALRQFKIRLDVMLIWAEHMGRLNSKKQDLSRLGVLKEEIMDIIQNIQKDISWKKQKNSNVLIWMMQYMQEYLNGQVTKLSIYSELLYTGVIGIDDSGMPVIDETLAGIRFYEPWRNALKHIVFPKKTAAEVKEEILGDILEDGDEEAGLKDNLHQLEMLGRSINSQDEDYIITEGQLKEAVASADERTIRFLEALELAYTYNQINETEKETLAGIMTRYRSTFYEFKDFASWRRFLEALEQQSHEFAAGRKQGLRAKLDEKLLMNPESSLLKEADRILEKEKNFSVAEEYITRFDCGETELEDDLDFILHDKDYFGDFLSRDHYDELLQKCRQGKGRALKNFGWEYIDKHLPEGWTKRLRESSRNMVNSWPVRKDAATSQQMQMLFKCLGFDVTGAVRKEGYKEEMFQIIVKPVAKSMADYRHPIAAFGTQMKRTLNVIILYGNYTDRQLVDTVSAHDLGGISIVLIDQPLDAARRRLIGQIFHTQTSGQNPFLLIDQVLFLYLAMHQETERLPALLKCTLPYTTYQPFVRDGGSTADEMFCGRSQELATIIDLNGACVVYGGRQLGKTALLERAESRCSKPENKEYAVYSTIIRIDNEAEVVETLIIDIDRKTRSEVKLSRCGSLKEMCSQLSKLFRDGKIATMHLLIDEVDCFLETIADEAYRQIQPLVDLKRETKNRFKFVLTGLHNVCRAKNATKENGIFGQLGTPLCIKPLSPVDALKLLSRPLNYLGFQIDRYPHLETILTNTNYYPGILQFFGYMLVETLNGQYTKYYRAADGNPPFTLQDEQLGAVMNSADLNKSIKDKFRWSLELDSRYFMIARCITLLYHYYEEDRSAGSWMGFAVREIREMADAYHIHCLEHESEESFTNLLDEMVEMGILSQPETGLYRLRRSLFVDIIGENIEILEHDIANDNKENI